MNLRRPLILFATLLLGGVFIHDARAAPQAAARTLYLVRHGAYDNEAARTADGPGLVPLGIAQARLTAARLQALPNTPKAILTSSMLRARQTAAVLHETLAQVPIETTDALRECTPTIAGREGAADAAHACEQRLDAVYAQYFVPAAGLEETDVLVCHGNVIRYFVMKALAVDATHWLQMTVGNASITVIRVEANGVVHVLSVGDVGHLPANMQSGFTNSDPQLIAP